MKKKYILLVLAAVICIAPISSCKTGYGCEATENYKAQTNRKGELSRKKGKTNLFSKKKRKKVKRSS